MSTLDIWKTLEATDSGKEGGILTRRIHPETDFDLRLGVEKPSNTRVLILSFKNAHLGLGVDVPRSEGFELRRGFETIDGKKRYHLAVRLINPRFADVFCTLVDDVVSHVIKADQEVIAVGTLISRLERWQAFLKKHPTEGLSEEAQRGLYGELTFLINHAIPSLGIRNSVQAWTGPNGTNQDFEFGPTAVEAKVSTSKQHQKLMIASERQLDDTGLQNLLVYYLSLDVRQGGSDTLVAMVNRIRSKACMATLSPCKPLKPASLKPAT